MGEERPGRTNKGAIAGFSIGAAALAALIATRRVGAEPVPPGGVISLDSPAMEALLGLLEHSENLDIDFDAALALLTTLQQSMGNLAAAISALVGGGITLQNPRTMVAWRTMCPAANLGYQLPSRAVPYNMQFAIKALQTNLGVIQVGNSRAAAQNANDSYPLIANEAIMYKIRDTQNIWVCATIAGDGIACTVEQEGV